MPHIFRKALQISRKTSKSYRIVMLLILFVSFTINWLFMQAMTTETSATALRGIILRSVIEAILYLLVCHFFLRTYIKLKVLKHPITAKMILQLTGYLILVAVLYFSLSINLGKFDALSMTDIHSVQVINDQGGLDARITDSLLWTLGVAEYFLLLLAWSVAYIFWDLLKIRQKLQRQLQDAQFQQLTNQLSPHFLFNTLNTIRALIYEDPNTAAATVTQLSDLFRKQMHSNLQVKSSLEAELKISTQYLSIEKLRLEERLVVTTQIDAEVLNQFLPTLTLLTLVENAIKHGITPNITPGTITIKASKLPADQWTLTVTNSVQSLSTAPSTKTGLKNIKTRLKIMYGDQHTLTHKLSNHQFTAKMVLPYV